MARTSQEGKDDVGGTIHPGEAQMESEKATMSVPPI